MTQTALPGMEPLVTPDYTANLTIEERWRAWSAANPWVLERAERLLQNWFAAGHSRGSLKQVWEVMRYSYGITTGDVLKVNNDWTSRAAREILRRHPEWEGMIQTRELRAP